jgi:hypothetical protein
MIEKNSKKSYDVKASGCKGDNFMKQKWPMAYRIYSVLGLVFIFAYLLSFLFEGQVLYGLLKHFNTDASLYIPERLQPTLQGCLQEDLFQRQQPLPEK